MAAMNTLNLEYGYLAFAENRLVNTHPFSFPDEIMTRTKRTVKRSCYLHPFVSRTQVLLQFYFLMRKNDVA